MAFCSAVMGVVWTTVPAGPARVTWVIRPSFRLMFRQERPLPRSAGQDEGGAGDALQTAGGVGRSAGTPAEVGQYLVVHPCPGPALRHVGVRARVAVERH